MRHARSSLVPRRSHYERWGWLSVLAFATTCATVFVVNLPRWTPGAPLSLGSAWKSIQFTAVLMGILVAHEAGHSLVARAHRFRLGPPWFIPFPWFVGTMGAIILPLEAPRNRTALGEMGAAGPLTGAAMTVLVIFAMFVIGQPAAPVLGDVALGTPLIWWVGGLFIDNPVPAPSVRDPIAFAAWIGCLVTSMNLLPFGQLDGGHIWASMWPSSSRYATWCVTALLLGMGWFWPGWLIWVAALHLLGSSKPMEPRSVDAGPARRARVMAALCAMVFVLFATPVPLWPPV